MKNSEAAKMLVPFVIDADSLAPDPDWTPPMQRSFYKSLLDVWQKFGLLAHDGETLPASRLYEAVQGLPQSVRSLWQTALMRVPLLSVPHWNGSVSAETLNAFAGDVKMALIDDTRAEVEFGFGEGIDEVQQLFDGMYVSVCRWIAADQAKAFQTAEQLANTHIQRGDSYQKIWNTRFKTLAKAPAIKRVHVVDRYAISQHSTHGQDQLSGLERFLRLLDSDAGGSRYVEIYSARTSELSQENINSIAYKLCNLFDRLPRKNIKHITIHMARNEVFGKYAHDRFILFGDCYAWDIGSGLEVFDGPAAARYSSASFKSGDAVKSYKDLKQKIDQHPATESKEIP